MTPERKPTAELVDLYSYVFSNPTNLVDRDGLQASEACSGCSLRRADPTFLRKLASEAAAKGALSKFLGGAGPAAICDLFEKDCANMQGSAGEGFCPPGTEIGDFCEELKALCAGTSKELSPRFRRFLDDGTIPSSEHTGGISINGDFAGGRGRKVP
jgi:hypothetical protein